MATTPDGGWDGLIDFFHRSSFQYLALDHGGASIRLARDEPGSDVATPVRAPSIGFVTLASGRRRFPQAGDRVARGEPILAIRKYRQTIEVVAPAAGSLASLAVAEGAFVEFGAPLATIAPAPSSHQSSPITPHGEDRL